MSEGNQKKAEPPSRMWAEPEPGPSRCEPSRQGYCGYCRVLYTNLDQHLSSLRHLDSVRTSSRGSAPVSVSRSNQRRLTLLERFLQDVQEHHPHRYSDARPSHADLPSVSAPLLPKAELDELCSSDEDGQSLGTREHLPSSDDASCELANQERECSFRSQSGEGAGQERQDEGGTVPPPRCTNTPPPQPQAPPSVHRKAHRKTNRRKPSESSSSTEAPRAPGLQPHLDPSTSKRLQAPADSNVQTPSGPRPQAPSEQRPQCSSGPVPPSGLGPQFPTKPGAGPPSGLRPQFPTKPEVGPPSGLRPQCSSGPGPPSGLRPHFPTKPGVGPPSGLRPQFPTKPGVGPPSGLRPQFPTKPEVGPPSGLRPQCSSGPGPPSGLRPHFPTKPEVGPPSGLGPQFPTKPEVGPPSGLGPFVSWQRERREVQKEEAFSSHSDPVEQTIEEVIQMCCYSFTSPHHQQEELESLHLSLPVSMETQSEDWDTPVQVVFQRAGTPTDAPVQVAQKEGRDLGRLMDVQVDMEDQVYSNQLDSALLGGGAQQDQGFWNLPIEDVLPVPEHIPESFRGKTWTQIEQEDEERVERLVQQFRRGRFICYFDTESLARFGRRRRRRKEATETQEAERDTGVLPFVDQDVDDSACVRMRKRRRSFRVASRCQVVKVSHGTQTLRLVIPTVHQLSSEAPPTSLPAANERTPETQTWHSLPPSYSSIVTPVQPRTSLVYLLCSPSCSASTPPEGSTLKRCRRRRRPVNLQRLKVKYKRLPVKFYEPGTNQILRNPPQGLLRPRGPAPSSQPPPCVRQLFRNLSPDLNMDRRPGAGPKGDTALMSTLSADSGAGTVRRRGRMSQTPPTPTDRSQRERGGRPRLPPSQRRTRIQVPPPLPRREGLRRAAPSRKALSSSGHALHPPRRGRSQRGRGCERGSR